MLSGDGPDHATPLLLPALPALVSPSFGSPATCFLLALPSCTSRPGSSGSPLRQPVRERPARDLQPLVRAEDSRLPLGQRFLQRVHTKLPSRLMDAAHAGTYRLHQSGTATRYPRPTRSRGDVMSVLHTGSRQVMVTLRRSVSYRPASRPGSGCPLSW